MIKLKTERLPSYALQIFDEMSIVRKDIDAVGIATPNHNACAPSPGGHGPRQTRLRPEALAGPSKKPASFFGRAKETKLPRKMGNQGHSSADGRTAVEYVVERRDWRRARGAYWTNRPLGFWPKGVLARSR